MPRRILGYPLTIDWRAKKPQTLKLPIQGATPLSVELVDGSFVLYVEHDPKEDGTKMREIVIFKAGQDVNFYITADISIRDYIFVGTVVNGPWAWHVYIHTVSTTNKGKHGDQFVSN